VSPALAEAYVALANCDAEFGNVDRARALAARAGAILAALKHVGNHVAPPRDIKVRLSERRT